MKFVEFLHSKALDSSWALVFLAVSAGFTIIYFGFALAAVFLTKKVLPTLKIGQVVESGAIPRGQGYKEIINSLASILVFGAYGVLTLKLDQMGWIHIRWNFNAWALATDLLALTLWNELHFYLYHRVVHIPWLYHRIHRIHHLSIIPTPFAAYSFHWFDSVLLWSVLVIGMFLYDFSILALILFPVLGLTIGIMGHMNYEIFTRVPLNHVLKGSTRHALHHTLVNGNYGFMLPYLDQIFKTQLKIPGQR